MKKDSTIWLTAEKVTNDVHEQEDPKDFFSLLFDDSIVSLIYEETLAYCGFPFAREELQTVIGIIILSGILNYPRRRMYWSVSKLLNNSAISASISQKRFEAIFSHLISSETVILRISITKSNLYWKSLTHTS